MGAAAFAAIAARQLSINGLAGIALEEYAACLGSSLAPGVGAACSVQLAHHSDVLRLLQGLADASQTRFDELVVLTKYSNTHAVPEATSDSHVNTIFEEDGILQLLMTELLTLSPTDTRGNDALQPDTQMLEIGLDSISVGALSGAVRNATGVAFKMADALQGEITVRQLAQSLVERVEKARPRPEQQSGQTMETSVETSGPLFGRCENLPLLIPSHSLLHTHSSLAVPCGFDLSTTCCTPWCASDGRCGVSRPCVGCLLHVHLSVQERQRHGSKSRSTLSVSCLTHQVRSAPLRQLI